MPALTTLTGAATVAYSAAILVKPDLMLKPGGMGRGQDHPLLTRMVGVRDAAVGLAMVLAPAGPVRRAVVGARVASDWGDALVMGIGLRGRDSRGKAVGVGVVWGALCLAALRYDER
ncbi:hypothetical protein SAMN05660199_03704 [Klenkia soli]|uniref:DoxX-like family protein n=1 Tax=Klenkia soli TaxID=1052260 RepID=A0A1H0S0M5_9ACTN|nr:hypothetical protein [Klenkia soli]SDP35243.1 hypothetical protein SAMN05660199_03704 [Klenkia soli]